MFVRVFRISFKKLAVLSAVLAAVIFCTVCTAILRPLQPAVPTEEICIHWLAARGIEVDPAGMILTETVIPADFDEIYQNYSRFQRTLGFELWNWAGMTAEHRSWPLTNAPNNRPELRANLLTCHRTVIAFELYDPLTGEYFGKIEEISQ